MNATGFDASSRKAANAYVCGANQRDHDLSRPKGCLRSQILWDSLLATHPDSSPAAEPCLQEEHPNHWLDVNLAFAERGGGVLRFDAALVSPEHRLRAYWTNMNVDGRMRPPEYR